MRFDRVIAIRNTITIFRDGNQCIKCFHSACSKEDVLSEALNQVRMESAALHIPQVHEIVQIDGKWSIVMEYIRGKTLEQHILENPGRMQEYLEQLADLQTQIRRQNVPMLPSQKSLIQHNLICSVTDPVALAAYQAQLDTLPQDTHICHGNLEPSNIIISDDGIPYLLDWRFASVGSITADAAATLIALKIRCGQAAADLYLHSICQKNAIEQEQILKWVPLTGASHPAFSNYEAREYSEPSSV